MKPRRGQSKNVPALHLAAVIAWLSFVGLCPATAQETTARHGMVVAKEARAARIGLEVLKKGGNAVDAAVATGFALAVTYPRAGNIGGGGYMVIHLARGNRDIAIDYRETAPQGTTRDIFLDQNGEADPEKSRDSPLAIGVPGTVAGLTFAERRYGSGRFTLAELIKPAIALARDGIPIADDVADSLPHERERIARWPSSARIFLHPDGSTLAEGDALVQSDLAATLEISLPTIKKMWVSIYNRVEDHRPALIAETDDPHVRNARVAAAGAGFVPGSAGAGAGPRRTENRLPDNRQLAVATSAQHDSSLCPAHYHGTCERP